MREVHRRSRRKIATLFALALLLAMPLAALGHQHEHTVPTDDCVVCAQPGDAACDAVTLALGTDLDDAGAAVVDEVRGSSLEHRGLAPIRGPPIG